MALDSLLPDLKRNWGWIVVRGVAAVIFGVLAFMWPAMTLAVLLLFWGAYALIDGVLAVVAAFRVRDRGKPFWALLIVGVLGVAAGILTFFWPGITALVLLTFIAVWALVMGIFQIVAAIRLRKVIENEWLMALSGVLSVIFGALMLWSPGAGALAVVWIIASYAIIFGILLIALGFRLRSR
ncbi:MAG TPA: HdeD family acid-resistance protein [Burkholderiaceae bacterium]|nr:HdeD family acid-resistance protein [Burkholderiaceae bacterium]